MSSLFWLGGLVLILAGYLIGAVIGILFSHPPTPPRTLKQKRQGKGTAAICNQITK